MVGALFLYLSISAGAVELSSATVKDPYDLLQGTIPATAELSKLTWFPESLNFEIKWGMLYVGDSTLESTQVEKFNGSPAIRIVSRANSSSFCDTFYKVRDLNESWVQAKEFYSLGYSKHLREGHFQRDEWVLYDYPRKTYLSKTINKDGAANWGQGPLPGNYVQDILSSLYYIRNKPLKVGDEVTLDVNTKSNWPLVIKVLKKTTLEVPAGQFNCIVVQPFLRQEGIFVQKGKDMKVWMTDDDKHMPVALSVQVFFGHVTAELKEIKRPQRQ